MYVPNLMKYVNIITRSYLTVVTRCLCPLMKMPVYNKNYNIQTQNTYYKYNPSMRNVKFVC